MTTPSNDRAARLRELHRPGSPLLLPNVWDAASAATVEAAGFPALATASAAISAMLGYPDHEGAPAEDMLAAAGRVVRAARVPVTVDAEAGYGLAAAELVGHLAAIGAAGCNLEDSDHRSGGLAALDDQARRIAEVRAAAVGAGVDLVINARVDVFLDAKEETPGLVAEAVERGRRYLEAGADCVYPIMAVSEDVISTLVAGLPGPVNVLALPNGPSLSRLAELGVARVSYGPQPYRRALGTLEAMAARIAAHEDPFAS
ncbi:isocitrate lyase/PEP mutase family protein [Rhizohabitans arisaemae]|uniref:isocitrate lyase/PEP mutase family protein n=1 Tax=Rhizohabitans arisaemae TaxID=2720610 RepID=UPI0024B261C7|nr:isocitrate lyase/phosphoenolpyruvate mutase family protein [Rhizohabitans arisaemae]